MAFISGYEFILKNELGIIFNFYLNEQKYIEYIISNNNGKWEEKNVVISEPTENYSIEIDKNSNIHIISFHSNGSLYYSYFDNIHWQNHLIAQYPITDQRILYPTIKYINNQVHMFYYLLNIKDKNKAYLLHLNFNHKDYKTNHITTVFSHSYFNPFKVFHNEEAIFILYGSVVDSFDQVFISKLNLFNGKWDDPICITSSKEKKIYLDGLLDHHQHLHIVWSNYDEEFLVVKYLNISMNQLNIDTSSLEPISLSSKSSCSFPTLCYYKKVLWALWVEMNKIVSSYSLDCGESWSEPFIHESTRMLDFKRYRYIANYSESNNDTLCDFVFGSLYPNIQFLGFGGETNDDIPASE